MACKFYNNSCKKCMNINRASISGERIILHQCYPGTDKFKHYEECKFYKNK